MSRKSKIVIIAGVMGVLVFGFLTRMMSGVQKEAKNKLIDFLRVDCLMGGDILTENGVLTLEAVSFIKKQLGDWRDQAKQELWDHYRTADYWFSTCKTLVALSIFLILFIGLRMILSRIYISEELYGKFRPVKKKGESPRITDIK